MKAQGTENKIQNTEHREQTAEKKGSKYGALLIIMLISCLLTVFIGLSSAFSSDKWPGVDETVVQKYAKEHGREAKDPLINTDQGDLLLFVFLIAGAIGGFAAGYSWKALISSREHRVNNKEQNMDRSIK